MDWHKVFEFVKASLQILDKIGELYAGVMCEINAVKVMTRERWTRGILSTRYVT